MSRYLHDDMPAAEQQVIVTWLIRNGCRDHVALEPILIKGNYVEYTAMCRRDHKSVKRMKVRDYEFVDRKRKRLRIRFPLNGGQE